MACSVASSPIPSRDSRFGTKVRHVWSTAPTSLVAAVRNYYKSRPPLLLDEASSRFHSSSLQQSSHPPINSSIRLDGSDTLRPLDSDIDLCHRHDSSFLSLLLGNCLPSNLNYRLSFTAPSTVSLSHSYPIFRLPASLGYLCPQRHHLCLFTFHNHLPALISSHKFVTAPDRKS